MFPAARHTWNTDVRWPPPPAALLGVTWNWGTYTGTCLASLRETNNTALCASRWAVSVSVSVSAPSTQRHASSALYSTLHCSDYSECCGFSHDDRRRRKHIWTKNTPVNTASNSPTEQHLSQAMPTVKVCRLFGAVHSWTARAAGVSGSFIVLRLLNMVNEALSFPS
jgi:hypothetical protein